MSRRYSLFVNTQSRPCPQCGSAAIKRIVWTDDPGKIGTSDDATVAFLSGPLIWNDVASIDRVCADCNERFCNDIEQQEKYDEDTRRQKRRMEAMKRGEYMLFDPRTTSVDEIAHAVFEQIERSKNARANKNEAEN